MKAYQIIKKITLAISFFICLEVQAKAIVPEEVMQRMKNKIYQHFKSDNSSTEDPDKQLWIDLHILVWNIIKVDDDSIDIIDNLDNLNNVIDNMPNEEDNLDNLNENLKVYTDYFGISDLKNLKEAFVFLLEQLRENTDETKAAQLTADIVKIILTSVDEILFDMKMYYLFVFKNVAEKL